MTIEERWHDALQETEIVRLPIKKLLTLENTSFDYILLSASEIHKTDTVVRKGKIEIHKPALFLPSGTPMFEGFASEEIPELNDAELENFFYLRGISFPSLRYKNEAYELDLYEGTLSQAAKHFEDQVRQKETIGTGILIGNASSWQFSVLILGCYMIQQHIEGDLRVLLNKIKKR